LAIDILRRAGNKPHLMKQLVLQPQNAIELVREYIYIIGYEIEDEKLVLEGDKFYTVMSVKYTGTRPHDIRDACDASAIDYFIGPRLVENKDPLLLKYIDKEILRLQKILENAYTATSSDRIEQYVWLLDELLKKRGQIQ